MSYNQMSWSAMKHVESNIQIGCVRWFRLAYPALATLLFSVPNGGYRNAITAKVMKAEGQVAGVSDLILLYPNNHYHALCIEMKAEKGRQSEHQKAFQKAVDDAGYKYIICHNFDEFRANVCEYLRNSAILNGRNL